MIKIFIKKYFKGLTFFYSYLRYRIFVLLGISLLIGILDGLGLSMFLPLLQMVDDSSAVDPESLGNLRFIVDFVEWIGFSLDLFFILGFMVSFFFLKGIIQYAGGIYKVKVLQGFNEKLRVRNIKGLNKLAYKYFVMSDVGRIQNTLTGEVDKVSYSYSYYFSAIEYGIMVIVYMAFAFAIDPQFAVLVVLGGGLSNFLYINLYKKTKGISKTLTSENSIFQRLIIQNVTNFKYLKATGSSNKYGNKLEQSVSRLKESNIKIGKLDALLTAGREPILITVVVAVIYIQTTLFGSDLGTILISLLFFYRALSYLMQMQMRWNKYLSFSGSLENMTLFGQELRRNKEKNGNYKLKDEIEEMELVEVCFNYENTRILNNISLKINRHETIAFVGESGSGKTTLVNILAGLLPIDLGKYNINNIANKEIDLNSFQTKIGYITQDPVIFNDTIFNNVTFWGKETVENKLVFWEVLSKAAILDFVNELPNKENTILGNNGVNLSGGQRQRISIARELYKKVEILILDEATSALDSETEKAIQKNIEDLKGSYTILIVAHRISTIKNADRIVVMKNGRISNVGNFSELIVDSPYFNKLVELQEV